MPHFVPLAYPWSPGQLTARSDCARKAADGLATAMNKQHLKTNRARAWSIVRFPFAESMCKQNMAVHIAWKLTPLLSEQSFRNPQSFKMMQALIFLQPADGTVLKRGQVL